MSDETPRLEADCSRCFGLCCVALPFARSADFPVDKPGGEPCRNLLVDHRCGIHDRLPEGGWRGCVTFDCFGAGQQVSQVTFRGVSWREAPGAAPTMYAVLPVMRQLHEMLAHLRDALGLGPDTTIVEALEAARAEVDTATAGTPDEVLAVDLVDLRGRVGGLLRTVSATARHERRRRDGIPRPPRRIRAGADLVGADLRGRDLRAADLRGALLIAADLRGADLRWADLLGADLRDADLRGTRLDDALFLTRPQLAAAHT
ncbi:pentapeptide repeat-containing protein [Terrabacter sp. GCM10028922]|uniref:pentapeptide repeat-containing protein n=1 Tax=Terrabacter sp. GCM10028922 TaxID=3273428 RepID=UPI00361580FE